MSNAKAGSQPRCVAACVTRDRLPYAQALAESIREHDDVKIVLAILGNDDDAEWELPFDLEVVSEQDLMLPELQRFLFQYTRFELCCAIKPWLIAYAHKIGYENVVYLDSDIQVYHNLSPAFGLLNEASVLLTPHIAGIASPWELALIRSDIRATGLFNAGFIGVASDTNGETFIDFWKDRCRRDCIVDFAAGIHVDQGWLDIAAAMLPGIRIVRTLGWNVGYWNAIDQILERTEAGHIQTKNGPLVFFHFSGFDPRRPNILTKHRPADYGADQPVLAELQQEYTRRLTHFGALTIPTDRYAFGQLTDGTSISPLWREAVRLGHPGLADIENPFDVRGTPQLKRRFRQAALDVIDARKDWQQRSVVALGKLVQAFPGLGLLYRRVRAAVEQYR